MYLCILYTVCIQITKSHNKCDCSIRDQRPVLSFFTKKIRLDELQGRSKVSTKNGISASVHDGNNSKDL